MCMINPNSDRDFINQYVNLSPEEKVRHYPQYFEGIRFDCFRTLRNTTLEFRYPVTVITGNNCSGKTSVLMSIACSHYHFMRRNPVNGHLDRNTWGQIMQFTRKDIQAEDWVYYVTYREGNRHVSDKRGARRRATKKWSGVAKKESQIGPSPQGRVVTLIDMERTVPLRCISKTLYLWAKGREAERAIDARVAEYLGYVYEKDYHVSEVLEKGGNVVYSYRTNNQYSSYNTATGEEVLTRVLRDICEAPDYSLVLIDEIESGLHPKIQRRLMDVINYESRSKHKQFIITTHSATIFSCVEPNARIFLNKVGFETNAVSPVSISEALSRMDSISHPLMKVYVEDEISKRMVEKAISDICNVKPGFNYVVKCVIIGSADRTYSYFKTTQQIYEGGQLFDDTGFACVLDGDMKNATDRTGRLKYPQEELLFFHFSDKAPERMLLEQYLILNPDEQLRFYMSQNPHCVLGKLVELGICANNNEAFEICWSCLLQNPDGMAYYGSLKDFLIQGTQHFSVLF